MRMFSSLHVRRVAATILAAVAVAAGSSIPVTASTGGNDGPTGPRAAEMADLLELQPGGIQVSDNAMAWDDGDTVVVWPDPGAERAPADLGTNVRADVIERMGLERQAAGDATVMGSYTSCPSGYYCFYTGSNYDGVRYQFSRTCSSYASSWGFNNQTSSWVNRAGSNKIIYAYNWNGGPLLWFQAHPSRDSYVGSSDNNRMSYWRCSHTQ